MTDYQRALKTWPAEWVEELIERACIIAESGERSIEDSEKAAFDVVSKRKREREGKR